MEAVLRIAPHKQDVSGVYKEGTIESQDDATATSFEMLSALPVTDNEVMLYDLLADTSPLQEIAIENEPLLITMATSIDNLPKSTQQTVEELSAANSRKLTAPLIMMPSQGRSVAVTPPSSTMTYSFVTAPTAETSPQKSELMGTTISDFQVANGGTNVITPGATVKAIEWAKVDLTATINSHSDKSVLASKIGEKLHAILQDKISVQASNGIKTAQIRLDPPDMGHIRLTVSIEGDKVSVNVSAQNLLVREGLIQASERLRHELINENFVDVVIDINSGNENEQGNSKQQQQQQIANNIFAEKDIQDKSPDEFIVKV